MNPLGVAKQSPHMGCKRKAPRGCKINPLGIKNEALKSCKRKPLWVCKMKPLLVAK